MENLQLSSELSLSAEIVDAFAAFTGDYSALHMREDFARRTRFRQRIAHGMLSVVALAKVQSTRAGGVVSFRSLKGRFLRPVGLSDRLRLLIDVNPGTDGEYSFSARWERVSDETLLTRVTGLYRVVPQAASMPETGGSTNDVLPVFRERDQDIIESAGQEETLRWRWFPEAMELLASQVLRPMGIDSGSVPCSNLLATLMLSPLVGMRLPGRRATFLGFEMTFDGTVDLSLPLALHAAVSATKPSTGMIDARVEVGQEGRTVAHGTVEALVNEAPRKVPGCHQLAAGMVGLGLKDRSAIIIGGSRGIGEATAKLLGLLGVNVMLSYYRGADDANAIVADIRENGGNAACMPCDVRDESQVRELIKEVQARWDRVDVLVNCAVHDFSPASALSSRWEDYLPELEVSLHGLHNACQAVVPIMRRGGGGKIINFSSTAVRMPVSGQSRYITAKAAVEGYTRSLARELAGSNIQVNLVIPCMTETDLVASVPGSYRERLAQANASGRHLQPEEVAQAVAFLASQWSNAMTGQAVTLNLGDPPFA